jgi:hypothetical protein
MKKYLAALAALPLLALVSAGASAEDQPTWADRISFKGDLRLRYEGISEQDEEDRARGRYRARLGVTADIKDNVKVVMQIATAASNPVSRNVTFDGGFRSEEIGFDLAYAEWAATDSLTVFGGKMKNPLYRAGGAPLVWDSDLNPEGVALAFEKGALFANLGSFSVEERSSSSDSLLTAVQVGGKFTLGDAAKLTAGVGYFGYSNTIGSEPFWDGNPRGNSFGFADDDLDQETPLYIYEYKNTEVFAQLDTRLGSWPFSAYAQFTRNGEVSEEDTGYAFGAKVGSPRDGGRWEASWTYMDVEADAVIATFNDSDFGGGQTDASGHLFKFNYAVSKSISLGGTFFVNEIDEYAGNKHDFDRYQLDVQFSFK